MFTENSSVLHHRENADRLCVCPKGEHGFEDVRHCEASSHRLVQVPLNFSSVQM